MTEWERRVAAVEAVKARFHGKPLVWGTSDCAVMAADLIQRLGGKPSLSKFGRYTTEGAALRALRRKGYFDLAAVLDGMRLAPIAPLFAWPGDIIGIGEESKPMMALSLYLGNEAVLGWHIPTGVCRPQRAEFDREGAVYRAWRAC